MKYPVPVDGYDRTPGKGIGHLFVIDRQGNLKKDIRLGEGTAYHPGGIDYDGQNVWVPAAGGTSDKKPRPGTCHYLSQVATRCPNPRRPAGLDRRRPRELTLPTISAICPLFRT
ncbi:DUF6454 family protein [Kribbella sp. CWNU-51]